MRRAWRPGGCLRQGRDDTRHDARQLTRSSPGAKPLRRLRLSPTSGSGARRSAGTAQRPSVQAIRADLLPRGRPASQELQPRRPRPGSVSMPTTPAATTRCSWHRTDRSARVSAGTSCSSRTAWSRPRLERPRGCHPARRWRRSARTRASPSSSVASSRGAARSRRGLRNHDSGRRHAGDRDRREPGRRRSGRFSYARPPEALLVAPGARVAGTRVSDLLAARALVTSLGSERRTGLEARESARQSA